jgi:hypothetical protein
MPHTPNNLTLQITKMTGYGRASLNGTKLHAMENKDREIQHRSFQITVSKFWVCKSMHLHTFKRISTN